MHLTLKKLEKEQNKFSCQKWPELASFQRKLQFETLITFDWLFINDLELKPTKGMSRRNVYAFLKDIACLGESKMSQERK